MSPEATGWVIAGALACFVVILGASLHFQGVLISREAPAPTGARLTSWVCDAPVYRFTTAQAHRAMQIHRHHLTEDCPRKAAAFRVLVEEGHATPDSGRLHA